MIPFNNWLIEKIISYLSAKQGFITETVEPTAKGVQAVVQDVFGHRYEIQIKPISRNSDYLPLTEGILYAKETNSLGFLTTGKTYGTK